MNLIEPVILAGAAMGGVVGAVMGFGVGPWWTVGGLLAGVVLGALALPLLLLALALLLTLVTQGPRRLLRWMRGNPG